MAAVDKGTAHVYGVSDYTVSNATVQSFTLNREFANTGTTENEEGNVIERRYDDRTTRATITLKYQTAYTEPSLGDVITLDTIKYIIEKITNEFKNKDFAIYTFEVVTSEEITLT